MIITMKEDQPFFHAMDTIRVFRYKRDYPINRGDSLSIYMSNNVARRIPKEKSWYREKEDTSLMFSLPDRFKQ